MGELSLITDGAVGIQGDRIVLVGNNQEVIAAAGSGSTLIDASGKVVMPGFVDPHTHVVFAGDRASEFEMRLQGASYMEILAAGGGIMETVRATREASLGELVSQSRKRLYRMLAHGTTTVEAKTGYGLDTESELKMLEAIRLLDETHSLDLVPTFLGAHAIPVEYKGRVDEYVDLVVDEMMPALEPAGYLDHQPPLFCDVFCEEGAFSVRQSRRILQKAKDLGMGLKIHADEFNALGGTALAVDLGATSADHLACTPDKEIALLADSDTVGVLLPGTPFGLAEDHYAPARKMIDMGVAVALATDLNPGTCYCESMPFILALACRHMGMTPAEAIVASTINAAHAVGLGHEVGSLEIGKKADLLVLDIPDYRHLSYRFGTNLVQTVIKAGRVVS
ncbi:MAG TPA: imidazolonepropionase [Anaerolineae bacterium]|nr:imidazolonepropionase [Anaerolineae bacterium]